MGFPPLGLEAMQAIAKNKGGVCLSERYKNARTPLLWQCSAGHRWRAWPSRVKGNRFKKGSWCRECFLESLKGREWPDPLTIQEMRGIAASRGGKCLSKIYDWTMLRWKCATGHEWDAKPSRVKGGTWCPFCAGNRKHELGDMQRIAGRRGGRCLSQEYVNSSTRLRWECSESHRWLAQPLAIKGTRNKRGSWCPICSDTTLGLERMKRLAAQRGGLCLSRRYVNNRSPLLWQCKNGHRWKAPAMSAQGSWCRKCFVERRKLTLSEMRAIARRRGGRCLSAEYVNNKARLLWECARGHKWRQRGDIVKNRGSWCARCAREDKLHALRKLAAKRGGECLSKRYVMNKVKLRWRCARGHEWLARPDMIKTAGYWCPLCARNKAREPDLPRGGKRTSARPERASAAG